MMKVNLADRKINLDENPLGEPCEGKPQVKVPWGEAGIMQSTAPAFYPTALF